VCTPTAKARKINTEKRIGDTVSALGTRRRVKLAPFCVANVVVIIVVVVVIIVVFVVAVAFSIKMGAVGLPGANETFKIKSRLFANKTRADFNAFYLLPVNTWQQQTDIQTTTVASRR